MCNSIADLDLIFSFAEYSMRSGMVRPVFGQHIDIENSRYPILDLNKSMKLIPNNIVSLVMLRDHKYGINCCRMNDVVENCTVIFIKIVYIKYFCH